MLPEHKWMGVCKEGILIWEKSGNKISNHHAYIIHDSLSTEKHVDHLRCLYIYTYMHMCVWKCKHIYVLYRCIYKNWNQRSYLTFVVRSDIPSTSKKRAPGMWATCSSGINSGKWIRTEDKLQEKRNREYILMIPYSNVYSDNGDENP